MNTKYSWFLILCSWEPDKDEEAIKKFDEMYQYLSVLSDPKEIDKLPPDALRRDIDPDSLKA
jgi:hypothetical protein